MNANSIFNILFLNNPLIKINKAAFVTAMERFGFEGVNAFDIVNTGKEVREEMSATDPEKAAALWVKIRSTKSIPLYSYAAHIQILTQLARFLIHLELNNCEKKSVKNFYPPCICFGIRF